MKNTLDLIPILLPTEESYIFGEDSGTISLHEKLCKSDGIGSPLYLYLTSNREITEGDYYYSFKFNDIQKSIKGELVKGDYDDCRRIEFATDPKLIANGVPALPEIAFFKIESKIYEKEYNQQVNFLEEFVKRYNGEQKEDELDLEDFNFDSNAYSLYKKGRHPAFKNNKQKGVDVKKLAKEIVVNSNPDGIWNFSQATFNSLVKDITKALQSNAGGFSLEDMKSIAIEVADWKDGYIGKSDGRNLNNIIDDFIQSLTPKQGEIEMFVEMEDVGGESWDAAIDQIAPFWKSVFKIKLINGQAVIHFK